MIELIRISNYKSMRKSMSNPLAELSQRILDSSNWLVVFVVNVL